MRYLSTELIPNPDRLVGNWVHRDVCDVAERQRQSRLLATLLTAGIILVSVLPLTFFAHAGFHPIAVLISSLSAGTLALAGVLMQSGRRAVVEIFASLLAVTGLTVICMITGGMTSPFLALALLLPIEAFRIRQDKPSLLTGLLLTTVIVLGVYVSGLVRSDSSLLTQQNEAIANVSVLAFMGLYGFIAGAIAVGQSTQMTASQGPKMDQHGQLIDCLPGLISIHNERGHCLAVHGIGAKELIRQVGGLTSRGLIENMHISDRIVFCRRSIGCAPVSIARTSTCVCAEKRQDRQMINCCIYPCIWRRSVLMARLADLSLSHVTSLPK